MTTAITQETRKQVARPLRVLVPLIKEDLKQAEKAGLPYKQAAGEKLLEAKGQLGHGEWGAWLKRNFALSQETARQWMILAVATDGQNPRTLGFSSMNDFHRQTGSPSYRSVTSKQGWHDPVNKILGRVDLERLREAELSRAEERDAQRKLALQLIDIGYKALATKLHPDKGGSRDAMARLNEVRDRLKTHA